MLERLAWPLLFSSLLVRPHLPCGMHTDPGHRTFSAPPPMQAQASSSLPARLLVSAVDGQSWPQVLGDSLPGGTSGRERAEIADTIHDVPLPALAGGGEFAMILIRDDTVSLHGSSATGVALLHDVS